MLSLDEVRYWFEGPALILNVTMTNQGDHVDLAPLLHISVSEWIPKETPGPDYGDDLQLGEIGGFLRQFNTRDYYYASESHPAPNRYWDTARRDAMQTLGLKPNGEGPRHLVQPGQSASMEFGFLFSQRREADEGYFRLDFSIRSYYPDGESVVLSRESGCFNDSIPEFYGAPRDGRIDCPIYDETGRDTDIGMALWGQEYAAKPMLTHDVARELQWEREART